MEKKRRKATALCALLAILCSGCAGNSFTSSSPIAAFAGRTKPATGQLQHLNKASEPSVTQQVAAAVTGNPFSKSVSGAFKKTTDYLTPKPKVTRVSDPLLLSHKSKPPGADLYVRMAAPSEQAGKTAQAEQLYRKALEIEPKNLEALLGYAHLNDRQSKFEAASKLYEKAVAAHPGSAKAHNDLGLCYARRGDLEKSLKSLERAVALSPKRNLHRNNIAKVLTKLNRPSDALQHLMAVNSPAIAHNNLGYFLQQNGQDQLSAVHFAQAGRLDPAFDQTRQSLATHAATLSDPTRFAARRPPVRVAQANTRFVRTAPQPETTPSYLRSYQGQRSQPAGDSRSAAGQAVGWQTPSDTKPVRTATAGRYSSAGAIMAPTPDSLGPARYALAPRPLPPVRSAIVR